MDDDALEVIRQAERIVWAAGWHLQEQSVLEELAAPRAWPASQCSAALREPGGAGGNPSLRAVGPGSGLARCRRMIPVV